MRTCVLVLLLVAATAAGQEPVVKLPAAVKGEVGDYIVVKAETDSPVVKWKVLSTNLKMFPMELLKDTKTAVFHSTQPGKYRVMAWTAKGDVPSDAAECSIEVLATGPLPPPPPPPPPPGPPNPPPPPPGPTDPFAQRIADAVKTDKATDADKKATATAMQGFYLSCKSNMDNKAFTTVGAFLASYWKVSAALAEKDACAEARRLCGEKVYGLFGEDADATLDDALRAKAAILFDQLAKIWGNLR
jgi:hypothetical protein